MPARIWALALPFLMLNLSSNSFGGAVPAAVRLKDVEYSKTNGLSLRLDGFFPENSRPVPAVIRVHGGAWVAGDRRIDVQPLFKPLEDAGFAWFSISYRLATDVT